MSAADDENDGQATERVVIRDRRKIDPKSEAPNVTDETLSDSGFLWRELDGVKVLVSRALGEAGFVNGFSTRLSGVSPFPSGDLNLAGLARSIADLAGRTRDNKVSPDELSGGTFTLTNTGSRGALFDTPVVFLPQVAILGTGIVTKKPVVVSADGSDSIAIRSTVYLALSYDHRIVDGADAARFLVAIKNRLEAGNFEAVGEISTRSSPFSFAIAMSMSLAVF